MNMPAVPVREVPEIVQDAMRSAGISKIPEAVPVPVVDQILLHAQYHLVELSAGPPYVHRVTTLPFAEDLANVAVVLMGACSSTRLNPNVAFRLTFGKHTFEVCVGKILVCPAAQSELPPVFSRVF